MTQVARQQGESIESLPKRFKTAAKLRKSRRTQLKAEGLS
mgnify:CR=1 FL=1